MSRRRENYVGSCIYCGAVLGIWIAGEWPQMEAHACPFERDLYEADEILAEMKAAKGEDPDAA